MGIHRERKYLTYEIDRHCAQGGRAGADCPARTLDIAERDPLEIYVDGSSIVLKKYQPACIFCDDAKDVINFKGKNVCPNCIRELQLK